MLPVCHFLLPWDALGHREAEGRALHGGGDLRTWCWGKMREAKSGKAEGEEGLGVQKMEKKVEERGGR